MQRLVMGNSGPLPYVHPLIRVYGKQRIIIIIKIIKMGIMISLSKTRYTARQPRKFRLGPTSGDGGPAYFRLTGRSGEHQSSDR